MSLSDQLKKDIVAAMKGKEEMRLSVLRMAKAALQLKEVEKLRPLDDTESIQLLQTLVKQRKESIDQFAKGGRQDLVDKETAELKFLEAYLPAGASEAEMDAAIAQAIASTNATSIKQMGAVVKAAREALTGKAVDGKALSDRIRDRLSKM
ncbi:MAG TPA: GatB/YqeY domain-containing protein [Candidatus Acidoferrum sp.]|nr:GatB/YqeY domain-containing protein [Candidatus Acidoferrum sp.]